MKPQIYLSVLFFMCTQFVVAQDFNYTSKLKIKVDENAVQFLKSKTPRCIGAAPEFSFNFESDDVRIRDEDNTSETPASQEKIKEIKEELEFSYKDAHTNYSIAQNYRILGDMMQYEEYMNRSYTNCEEAGKSVPDSVEYPLLKAQLLAEFQRTKDAEQIYLEIQKKHPNDSSSYAMLVMLYLQTGNFDEAEKQCIKGMKLFPETDVFYFYVVLTDMYKTLGTKTQDEIEILFNGTSNEELFNIKYAKEASEKYPKNPSLELTYLLSRTYLLVSKTAMTSDGFDKLKYSEFSKKRKKEIKLLEKRYKKALKNKEMPNLYMAYYSLGAIALLKGKHEESIDYFTKSLADRKKYYSSTTNNGGKIYSNLAAVNLLSKDTAETLRVLKQKIKARPEIYPNPNDYYLAVMLMLQSGKIEDAKSMMTTASADLPESAMSVRADAVMFFQNMEYSVAMQECEMLVNAGNQEYETQMLLGFIQLVEEDAEKAFKHLKAAYALRPDSEILLSVLDKFLEKE